MKTASACITGMTLVYSTVVAIQYKHYKMQFIMYLSSHTEHQLYTNFIGFLSPVMSSLRF